MSVQWLRWVADVAQAVATGDEQGVDGMKDVCDAVSSGQLTHNKIEYS